MTEHELTTEIVIFLRKEGFKIRYEVPNMVQSIDLLATKNRWVMTIEAKLNNWKKALAQCKSHELIADYICIAIATKKLSQDLKRETISRGYGLLHFDGTRSKCLWAIKPQRNLKVWPAQRRIFSINYRGIDYV